MTRRLDRARRLVRTARQAEDVAAARLLRANLALHHSEDEYRAALERASGLATLSITPGLRGLLLASGARAQAERAAERDRLRGEADELRRRWDAARTRTRSMDKLVERAIAERDARREAAERAELADVIASRAAAGEP